MTRRSLFNHAVAACAASILAKLPIAGAKPTHLDNQPDPTIRTRWITKAQLTLMFDKPVPVEQPKLLPVFVPLLIGEQLTALYECTNCGGTLVHSPQTIQIVKNGVCPFCNAQKP